MTPSAHPDDPHYVGRGGWLRAAVLGGNDGIISVASLIIGVAAADPDPSVIAISGVAGLVAGAMSMAAGEYISVSAQRDLEQADIAREKQAIVETPQAELEELTQIYKERGLSDDTAALVARELTQHDPLEAHLRDELGLSDDLAANPLQAAFASGVSFTVGAALPVLAALLVPSSLTIAAIALVSVFALALLGAMGAKLGGASIAPAIVRVVGWGIIAMAATAAIGSLFGVAV
ncbi:VIT family protein [Erythrobacter sp. SCSIO 43205]|uniref:VIT1/CCC1 transporter family protein n=1 Tax=Erythrobacter sp. SCSIO 43205 TaxID=2779361 RepID=UPI001CA7F273|nr:VIT family protein [Erythrobacter sp. SCSIO 43205]UAB77950.1 VIT family protein [Erythrobacter sp. SCSIO 43205]